MVGGLVQIWKLRTIKIGHPLTIAHLLLVILPLIIAPYLHCPHNAERPHKGIILKPEDSSSFMHTKHKIVLSSVLGGNSLAADLLTYFDSVQTWRWRADLKHTPN